MILVGGLPGTGKSTLAAALGEEGDLDVIASDRVRKELAGLSPDASAAAPFGEGLYSEEWNRRTYEACLSHATGTLERGGRVLVDASFRSERWRRAFLERGRELAVPTLLLLCRADRATVRSRVAERHERRVDPSDAGVEVYERAARLWEAPSDRTRRAIRSVNTNAAPEEVTAAAMDHLHEAGLI